MDTGKFDLSEFIRYVLTGTNMLLFDILLPLGFVAPQLLEKVISVTETFGLAAAATVLGFLLDMLKVYQLAPGYRRRRNTFMSELAMELEIPPEHASTYYTVLTRLSKHTGFYSLTRRHSEWVLIVNTALVFALSAGIWAWILANELVKRAAWGGPVIATLSMATSVALSIRLFRVGTREREKSRQEYLLFATKNKDRLDEAWRMKLGESERETPRQQ
jgi:hypothetical protein